MRKGSENAEKELPSVGEDHDGRGVIVRRDVGTGRSIVIIKCPTTHTTGSNNPINKIGEEISSSLRLVELVVPPPSGPQEWQRVIASIEEQLVRLKIRLCTVMGIGEGTVVAQYLAITHPKICQSLVLVDPVFQLSATLLGRFTSWVEAVLPLGLPLRIGSDQFVSAPFLHRIRCPTLVLVSPEVSAVAGREMVAMARRIPNAWYQVLNIEGREEQYRDLIQSFLLVRNRHPMRRAVG